MARLFARRKKNVPARKVGTGTSYTARGLQTIPTPQLDSESGSAGAAFIQEVVPVLATAFQRTLTYAKMSNNASVDASMRAAKTPVLGAEFFMEPFSDNPLDLEISEFIWANLSEGMSSPFLNAQEDILRMYEDGYAVLEKVYEQREWAPKVLASTRNTKNFIMLKKLGVRPVATIQGINYDDNGGPKEILQGAIQADGTTRDVKIPIEKLLVFTFGRVGGDLTGKSLLRTAYEPWYYMNHMYKVDAIQKERHGIGIPKGKLLPGFKPEDKAILRTLLRNIRTNEESFVMETPNVEITFLELSGNPVDVIKSAEHHGAMIMLNVLAQFLLLGMQSSSGGGGRSTSGTSSDIFMKSLKFVANKICEIINMYLIPELVVWNYPTKNFPKLNVRNIGETRDLQMLASGLANLFAQEIVQPTKETEAWTRRIFDMPAYIGTWTAPTKAAPTTPGNQTDQTSSNNGASTNGASAANGSTSTAKRGNVLSGQGNAGNVGKPPNASS